MRVRFRHRAATAFALFVFAFALPGAAGASGYRPATPVLAQSNAVNGECDHFIGQNGNYFGGFTQGFSSTPEQGTKAQIYVDSSRFQPCTNPDYNDSSGIMQWVAIGGLKPFDIIQIGVIKCNALNWTAYPDGACSTTARLGHLQYFYSWGTNAYACNGDAAHTPRPVWLGAAGDVTAAYHTFEVRWDAAGDGYVQYFIDGVEKKHQTRGSLCWLDTENFSLGHEWLVERWNTDDGIGGAGPGHFYQMQRAHGSSLTYVSSGISLCSSAGLDPDYYCQSFGTDHMGIYTVN